MGVTHGNGGQLLLQRSALVHHLHAQIAEAAQQALLSGNVRKLGASLGNVLEPVSRRMRPQLDEAIRAIEESGAVGARMTGSGSAIFGVYLHAGACKKAAEQLQKTYPTCRMMRTAECGVVIEEA